MEIIRQQFFFTYYMKKKFTKYKITSLIIDNKQFEENDMILNDVIEIVENNWPEESYYTFHMVVVGECREIMNNDNIKSKNISINENKLNISFTIHRD